MFEFLKSLFAPSAPASPSAAPGLTLTTLEGRDCPATFSSYSWVMLNPQPLPPGGTVMLNPQPLPPKWWG